MLNLKLNSLIEETPYTSVSVEGRLYTQKDLIVFAESLISECIDVIDGVHGSKKLMRPELYQNIVWAIEEYFGMPE